MSTTLSTTAAVEQGGGPAGALLRKSAGGHTGRAIVEECVRISVEAAVAED
ncbi:hypothetical protein KDC22_27135 [Paenibacillus tritici]|uniref:hypothetical protein n=1 Tax=Paenibacillus tritici TaxID=1873425 RepID=UPI001BA85D49|nr:hypothetical protein [Paenibacillus tritici]QUL53976.1 hypothetical protein KDC22_27135 [Paenibacillus tritici]